MTRPYEVFRVHEKQLQSSIPTGPAFPAIRRSPLGAASRSSRHCMARAIQSIWGHYGPAIAFPRLRPLPLIVALALAERVRNASQGPVPRFHAKPSSTSSLRSFGLGHGRGRALSPEEERSVAGTVDTPDVCRNAPAAPVVSDYERFSLSNGPVDSRSWNYRGCWHPPCPPVAVYRRTGRIPPHPRCADTMCLAQSYVLACSFHRTLTNLRACCTP
ncbi:MAG: hypothetical protein MHPSP_000634 [Paramarteilia canceri]